MNRRLSSGSWSARSAWSSGLLAAVFAGLTACGPALGEAAPIVLAVEERLNGSPADTTVLAFADGYLHEAVGGNQVFLDWRRGEVAVLDSGKRAWYRAGLSAFEKDMADLRRRELDSSRKQAAPFQDPEGGSLLSDACDEGPRGPFRKTVAAVLEGKPIPYPERLSAVPAGKSGVGSRAYLIKTRNGDSLAAIRIRRGEGLSGLRDFKALKAAYYRLWKAIEPSHSHAAAGFNVLAHPDVMELYRRGLPERAEVFGTGTCPERDESVFRPLPRAVPARFPDEAPKGFRTAPLAEVW